MITLGPLVKLPNQDRESIFLERDFVIIHDNFKTIWGPKNVDCQGKAFGVRVVKRGKPVVEAGLRVVPLANALPHVVVGILVQKLNRKTNLLIVLIDPSMKLCTFDLALMEKLSPDQIFGPTIESQNTAKEGRLLLSRYAKSSAALPAISEYGDSKSLERSEPKQRKRACEAPLGTHFIFHILITHQWDQ